MFKYNDEYVFQIDACPKCPDYGMSILDCNKVEICTFGTIVGTNTCPDFNYLVTETKIIYTE